MEKIEIFIALLLGVALSVHFVVSFNQTLNLNLLNFDIFNRFMGKTMEAKIMAVQIQHLATQQPMEPTKITIMKPLNIQPNVQ